MAAFFDATCNSCGRKYGWSGTMKDRPLNCPSCGAVIKISNDDTAILNDLEESMRQKMLKDDPKDDPKDSND